ncbi:MAG TPA: hypothetical protein VF715_01295 [Thermoleophilaceae bacterium]|jgi:hypothetical protein
MTRVAIRSTAGAVVALLTAFAFAGCGEQETVCKGKPERLILVPFATSSDHKTALELAPAVADQMAARAAESCGTVGGGVANRLVESELAVELKPLEPENPKAPNRTPHVRKMKKTADRFLQDKVLGPLEATKPSGGSPFVRALTKIADELRSRGHAGPSVIALVGDIIDIERAPSGRIIDFREREVDREALEEFLPRLEPLAGSCVVAIGAGARSTRDPEILRQSRTLLHDLLTKAKIRFVATRSSELPATCRAR